MKSPFSYVVLRYMHDVFTREFVNIGVVVYCPQGRFLRMKGVTRMKRALDFFPGTDRGGVLKTLRFMESRFAAHHKPAQQSLQFETLDAADIARAILPNDDSSLQWSPAGGGITEDPGEVLEELFERMVTRHEDRHPAIRRTDEEVWQPFETALQAHSKEILSRLHEKELTAGSFRHRFEHVWQPKQGPLHLLLPLSFDLLDPSNIVDKAIGWNGRIRVLRKSVPDFQAVLLIGKPSEGEHASAYSEAKEVLESDSDSGRKVVPEEQVVEFADQFFHSMVSAD